MAVHSSTLSFIRLHVHCQNTKYLLFPPLFFAQQVEVFNILFIREQEKRHVVHCMSCARKQSPNLQGFVCLEEYRLKELMDLYDKFVLSMSLPPPPPVSTAPQNALAATQQQNQQKETPVAS